MLNSDFTVAAVKKSAAIKFDFDEAREEIESEKLEESEFNSAQTDERPKPGIAKDTGNSSEQLRNNRLGQREHNISYT